MQEEVIEKQMPKITNVTGTAKQDRLYMRERKVLQKFLNFFKLNRENLLQPAKVFFEV